MLSTTIALLAVWSAVVLGITLAVRHYRRVHTPVLDAIRPGWIYFISPIGGADDEPPAPIKIGCTSRDPLKDRLPEIETMSPTPLELLWCFKTTTIESKVIEARVHSALARYRMHGEWFEREPTLMYIDYLRGRA